MFGEKELDDILITLFHLKKVTIDDSDVFISSQCSREVEIISSLINSKSQNNEEKIDLVKMLQGIDF